MASVLPWSPVTPLDSANTDKPRHHRSFSSLASLDSTGTVRRCRQHQVSISSLFSKSSGYGPFIRHWPERLPSRASSAGFSHGNFSPGRAILHSKTSLSHSLAQSTLSDSALLTAKYQACNPEFGDAASLDATPSENSIPALIPGKDQESDSDIWHDSPETTDAIDNTFVAVSTPPVSVSPSSHLQSEAFRRWVSTLRRRTHATGPPYKFGEPRDADTKQSPNNATFGPHSRSGSYGSSLAFVTGVRSASMTMTNSSMPSINAQRSARSPRSMLGVRSDPPSCVDLRRSMDSDNASMVPALDEAAINRSQKRARKLQELVRTEEGYVNDLKCLQNAYFTLLQPQLTAVPKKTQAAQACLTDLIQLHEEILAQVQVIDRQLVPCEAEVRLHGRQGRSRLGSLPSRQIPHGSSRTPHLQLPGQIHSTPSNPDYEGADHLCPPELAADAARVFITRAKRLAVYEEYGVRCDFMQDEVDAQRMQRQSLDYDRALEALQSSVCPTQNKDKMFRKAMGLRDLLIKPIQRITRYELLFRDLCNLTPSCDDPTSHGVIDDALFVISQTCHDLNEARGDPQSLVMLDSQRLLQQRLMFDGNQESILTDFYAFGKLRLCGALYLAYRGSNRTDIKGRYAVCALYDSCLIVASSKDNRYGVLVVADLARSSIEDSDNGKALQCHTTPFTWKLIFESEGALFELLCVACSALEADVWRQRIAGQIAVASTHLSEGRIGPLELRSPLADEMISVGKAYGRAVDFKRRASVQRAATLGPLKEINQVIIKNTQAACKESEMPSMSLVIPRSQSVISPSHIPTLTPRRSDRINIESQLRDVWTKDIPFPGLGSKRSEYSMRASAGHVIRKLSIASITSNFSRRSVSYTNISQVSSFEGRRTNSRTISQALSPKPAKPAKRPLEAKIVNFQTAPEAFLPEDFELKGPSKARGRLAGLRTFTLGGERPKTDQFVDVDGKNIDVMKRSRSTTALRPAGTVEHDENSRSKTAMSNPELLSMALKEQRPDQPSSARQTPSTGHAATSSSVDERASAGKRAFSRLARLLA